MAKVSIACCSEPSALIRYVTLFERLHSVPLLSTFCVFLRILPMLSVSPLMPPSKPPYQFSLLGSYSLYHRISVMETPISVERTFGHDALPCFGKLGKQGTTSNPPASVHVAGERSRQLVPRRPHHAPEWVCRSHLVMSARLRLTFRASGRDRARFHRHLLTTISVHLP